jgi:predicted glycosyltransferase
MRKKILVAPLNWGLGHATRCIPIINALILKGFEPIIASDGAALELLKVEFPDLIHLELPAYNIRYSKSKWFFKWKIFTQIPKVITVIRKEKKTISKWEKYYNLDGIISDNRFGVRSSKLPSVFMTHQLMVISGKTTWLTTFIHSYFIKSFNEYWVPDNEILHNLSGDLGHKNVIKNKTKYIGILSRLEAQKLPIIYDLFVVLSGPEPQRTYLEEILFKELINYEGKILFVKGKVEKEQKITTKNNFHIYNFMDSRQIEKAFNESDKVLCRSGYTTIMDLAKLNKKAFFIPTPSQSEQEYLAKKNKHEGIAPYCKQGKFTANKLNEIDLYRGFQNYNTKQNWDQIFSVFNK